MTQAENQLLLLQAQVATLTDQLNAVKQKNVMLDERVRYYVTNPAGLANKATSAKNKHVINSIRDVLIDEIFPQCKFVSHDALTSIAPGSLAMKVMSKLGIEDGERMEFWWKNWKNVRKEINEHRTKSYQGMKKCYLRGKWVDISDNKDTITEMLSDIL